MSFIKIDNTLYFSHNYNNKISNKIISILMKCNKIYFNNYDNYEICFETNNFLTNKYYCNYKESIFNQPINNLPNSITHLTLGWYFNQPIDNLPNSIIAKKLV